jgi:hypothetical protein
MSITPARAACPDATGPGFLVTPPVILTGNNAVDFFCSSNHSLRDIDAANEKPDWHSRRALALLATPTPLASSSLPRSAVSRPSYGIVLLLASP